MSDVKYEQGEFCWADLSAHDIEAAKRWYSEVFGWEMTPTHSEMHYSTAMQGGEMIAGVGQMPDAMREQGAPPMWSTYAWVDDCAKVEAAAVEQGATVISATMQLGELGSMAFLKDPSGAMFGLWQPGQHRGAGLTGAPISMCWNELMTRDLDQAKDFYAKALGWSYQAMPMGDFDYTTIRVGERSTGGMMPMTGAEWEGVPPHWMVYFAVADTDAICRKIEAAGGKVCVPPTDLPVGRFAVVNDPQGAVFSVIALTQQ